MDYCFHILIFISLFTVLGVSLNLVAGYAGLLSLCHAAFFGIGAYATAVFCLKAGMPWLLAQALGVALVFAISALLGLACLRFRQDYFVVSTLAFQVVIFSLLRNWSQVTGGPLGIAGIPSPEILSWRVDSNSDFFVLSTLYCLTSLALVARLVRSPYGVVLKSIREDETTAAAMGKNVAWFRISAFVVSACLASLSGGLYASYVTFIDPSSFTINESILILAIVVIGGAGSIAGSVLGASFVIFVPEALHFAGLSSPEAANVRQILYGTTLIAFMILRPQGLVGHYSFGGPTSDK